MFYPKLRFEGMRGSMLQSKLTINTDNWADAGDISGDLAERRILGLRVNEYLKNTAQFLQGRPEATAVITHWKMAYADRLQDSGIEHKDLTVIAREFWDTTENWIATQGLSPIEDQIIHERGYFQWVNEPYTEDSYWAKLYSDAEIANMEEAQRRGWKRAIFSYAVGNPGNMGVMKDLLPALVYANANGHGAAFHEYMQYIPALWFNKNQVRRMYDENGKQINEYLNVSDPYDLSYGNGENYLACRYRHWLDMLEDELIKVRTDGGPDFPLQLPVFITETGLDLVGNGDVQKNWLGDQTTLVAWADAIPRLRDKLHDWAKTFLEKMVPELKEFGYLGDVLSNEEIYLSFLVWYDNQIGYDPNVKWASIFVKGAFGWGAFQVKGLMWELLRTYWLIMTKRYEEKVK